MPGRTPTEAFEQFIDPIRAATACLGFAKILCSPGARSDTDGEHSWSLNGPGKGLVLPGGICFKASMRFRYVKHDEGWRVSTRGYMYSLTVADVEVWSMHWHPTGTSDEGRPHLHAAIGDGSIRNHLPVGRMTYEDAVEWVLTLSRAIPANEHWRDVLNSSKAIHIQYRSWSGDGPEPAPEAARS